MKSFPQRNKRNENEIIRSVYPSLGIRVSNVIQFPPAFFNRAMDQHVDSPQLTNSRQGMTSKLLGSVFHSRGPFIQKKAECPHAEKIVWRESELGSLLLRCSLNLLMYDRCEQE